MTKTEIVAHLAEKTGLTRKQVSEFFDEQAKLAYQEAPNGFTLPGLGKLVLAERAARMGRNPKTGEPIQIPAKRALKFRFAKEAKDAITPKAPEAAAPAAPAPAPEAPAPALEAPALEPPAA
jgi:DNA-binding protein HU-beta